VAKHRGSWIRELTIAGALIAAEIDRLQRAQKRDEYAEEERNETSPY